MYVKSLEVVGSVLNLFFFNDVCVSHSGTQRLEAPDCCVIPRFWMEHSMSCHQIEVPTCSQNSEAD